MTTHTADSPDSIAVHEKVLVAGEVDVVEFGTSFDEIEVASDGAARLYFTCDGSEPTVKGENCHSLPAEKSARVVAPPQEGVTVVKLISLGTPTYTVQKV